MKKIKWIYVLIAVMMVSFSLSAQKPADLVGTWEGEGTLEGEPDPNILTLVLKLEDGTLVGHMSDQYGSMVEIPIEEVTVKEGVFSFSVYADMDSQPISVKFTMKVDGDSMEGKLEIPDMGMTGAWEATKQK